MADATPSVRAMDTESRDLLDRMSNNDPRRGMVNRLLFKLADLIGGTAIATLPTQSQVADDRDVVEEPQFLQTGEAPRTRPHDAFFVGQPGDDDV